MEYVPLLAQNLESGRVLITKRDNSSLNLFFTRIGHGVPASDAFSELGDQGYLEPNATDLFPEIKDQWNKARITRNVCSLITKTPPPRNDPVLHRKLPDGPDSPEPRDVAKWFGYAVLGEFSFEYELNIPMAWEVWEPLGGVGF